MRVLITDSDNRSALAATRSLGQRGHVVISAGERANSLAAVSRYSSAFVSYPSAVTDPQGFVAAVARAVEQHSIDVLLPMTEITTLLLTMNRSLLPAGCRLPFADNETVARASDKSYVMALGERLGVPIPRTHVVRAPAEIEDVASQLSYPAVIKPSRSRVQTPTGFISTGVSYALDAQALATQLRAMRTEEFPVLIQERIVGPGVGLFACYCNGRPIARFTHKRLREKPPSGGVSVLRESAPLDEEAVDYADRLLGALGWHGVAMVEFKRDLRDNSLRLMEINGRFWGSLQLAIDAGVDFPSLLVDMAAGSVPEPLTTYRLGVRSRWFWGDVDTLLTLMLRRRASLNLPPGFPGRWASLRSFLRTGGANQRDEVFRRDDPRPWLLESWRWITGG